MIFRRDSQIRPAWAGAEQKQEQSKGQAKQRSRQADKQQTDCAAYSLPLLDPVMQDGTAALLGSSLSLSLSPTRIHATTSKQAKPTARICTLPISEFSLCHTLSFSETRRCCYCICRRLTTGKVAAAAHRPTQNTVTKHRRHNQHQHQHQHHRPERRERRTTGHEHSKARQTSAEARVCSCETVFPALFSLFSCVFVTNRSRAQYPPQHITLG